MIQFQDKISQFNSIKLNFVRGAAVAALTGIFFKNTLLLQFQNANYLLNEDRKENVNGNGT